MNSTITVVCFLLCFGLSYASNYQYLLNQTLLNQYDTCYADLGGNFVLYYTLRDTDVDFAIVGATTGWIGFGRGSGSNGTISLHGDPMLGYVSSDGSVEINDYYIESQIACDTSTTPPTGVCSDTQFGGSRDVSNVNGWEANGYTTLVWTRPLKAVDSIYDLDITNGTASYIVAFGTTDNPLSSHSTVAGAGHWALHWNVYSPKDFPGRCKNNCGGSRGTCVKGCCVCAQGYTGVECSEFIGGSSSDVYSDDGTSGGPSKGKIAGIILGTLLGLTVVVVAYAWIRKKLAKRQRKQRGIRLP